MPTYRTPDVYVEEISVFPPSVAEVGTAIPAFIGHTEFARRDNQSLLNKPTRIFSYKEYETLFGQPKAEDVKVTLKEVREKNDPNLKLLGYTVVDVTPKDGALPSYLLAWAVRMFFDNGGAQCYVVSVGDYTTSISDTRLIDGLKAVELEDEPTLLVIPEAVKFTADKSDAANYAANYAAALALYGNVVNEMLKQCGALKDRFAVIDIHGGDDAATAPDTVRGAFGSNNLKYGAAYFPFLKTSFNYFVPEAETNVKVTIKGVDNANKRTEATLANVRSGEAEKAGPPHVDAIPPDTAAYNTVKAELVRYFHTMPPSGAIAGVYAATDAARGVWKAPANASLTDVIEPSLRIDNLGQETLNVDATSGKSINAIRAFAGRGTMVWGARTLAGNDNEWRYVPVRRFFITVEESVKKSTQWAVFEPNDANTWVKVRGMIENYLTDKWRDGALAGATTKEAFYVKCGLGSTMTAQDILQGRMIVEIGMAVVRPAEFIVLKFSHKLQTS